MNVFLVWLDLNDNVLLVFINSWLFTMPTMASRWVSQWLVVVTLACINGDFPSHFPMAALSVQSHCPVHLDIAAGAQRRSVAIVTCHWAQVLSAVKSSLKKFSWIIWCKKLNDQAVTVRRPCQQVLKRLKCECRHPLKSGSLWIFFKCIRCTAS